MIPALMPNFTRADVSFDHGDGAWLFDTVGRRYLDFAGGIATSALGHAHPHLVSAIAEQAAKVIHVSNLYRIPQAETLAARLVAHSFADSVFFCNSGAEANEALIKAFRKAQADAGHPARTRIICFTNAFHGRTLATIAATGNPKYLAGFGAPVTGFDHVALNDSAALYAAITPETAGMLVEPIQGEGGIIEATPEFLQDLRTLCDERGLFLGFDEVQTGMGRTGKLLAAQWAGVEPDACSLAKGIGGGFPLAALLAKEKVAKALVPGSHGSTFGGGPLACAAGNAVLDVLLADGFLARVGEVAATLRTGLEALVTQHNQVFTAIRGKGLLLGLKCAVPNQIVQAAALQNGLLSVAAGDNILRLLPPLIIGPTDCDAAIDLLDKTARSLT